MNQLKDKVAFVTGADSGIGQAIALAFAKEGADVAVCYHSDRAGANETAAKIKAMRRTALVLKLDVTNEKQVNAAIDRAVEKFGALDILVNNAGVNGSETPVAEMDTKTFDLTLKTNLYGVFFGCRKFASYLLQSKRTGRILNVSSVHEEIAAPGNADYNASKGAVKMFTRTLALELAAKGITVNNIAPGMILTPMNQEAIDSKKVRDEMTKHIPMKRAGIPEEIAGLALFLAADTGNYTTGGSFFMDGGLMLNVGQGA